MGICTASVQKHDSTATPAVSFINESTHVIPEHLGVSVVSCWVVHKNK